MNFNKENEASQSQNTEETQKLLEHAQPDAAGNGGGRLPTRERLATIKLEREKFDPTLPPSLVDVVLPERYHAAIERLNAVRRKKIWLFRSIIVLSLVAAGSSVALAYTDIVGGSGATKSGRLRRHQSRVHSPKNIFSSSSASARSLPPLSHALLHTWQTTCTRRGSSSDNRCLKTPTRLVPCGVLLRFKVNDVVVHCRRAVLCPCQRVRQEACGKSGCFTTWQ